MYFLSFFLFYYLFFLSFFFVQYELTIVASDSLNEHEAKVVVFIRDVNDLPPVFDNSSYESFILEEEKSVQKILQVSFAIIFTKKIRIFGR